MPEYENILGNAIGLLRQLTPEAIDERLTEIESEASALRAIRRGMNARDRKSSGAKATRKKSRKETINVE